jgi:hypothetical protein
VVIFNKTKINKLGHPTPEKCGNRHFGASLIPVVLQYLVFLIGRVEFVKNRLNSGINKIIFTFNGSDRVLVKGGLTN